MTYFDDIQFIFSRHMPRYHCHLTNTKPNVLSLEYIASGKMYYQVDGQERRILDKPTVHWHYKNHLYSYGPTNQKGWDHYFVHMIGLRAERIYENCLALISDRFYIPIHNPDEYRILFGKLVTSTEENTVWSHSKSVALLEQILAMLHGETEPRNDNDNKTKILALTQHISEAPFEFHSLEQMAEKLHLSKPHFCRLFKKYIQKTPYDYVLSCKMRYAARRIMEGKSNITNIARQCGYEDLAQFSKLFHKQLKQWPSHFLKTHTTVSAE